MKKTFSHIIADIIQKKQTGLLSAVVKNGKHHLKIFFAGGEIYHMVYGNLRGAECLVNCEGLELSECFFANDLKVTVQDTCAIPTATVVEQLKKLDKGADLDETPRGTGEATNFADIQNKLKVALMRQVGPVGEIIFSAALEQWNPASPPSRQNLFQLVGLLKEKIEDAKNRDEFVKEINAIIS